MSALAAGTTARGAFIVLEGVDRCGKSTQAARLTEALGAEFMRFPDRTTAIGAMINSYLAQGLDIDDRAVHLLFSANRWEAKSRIEELLTEGRSIVCDRYAYSGVAFSGAKDGLSVDWCMSSDRGLPRPDVVIYLDLPIEQAMLRGEYGAERYEKEDFQRKVDANFKALQVNAEENWNIVDASKPIDELHSEITRIARQTVSRVEIERLPLGSLWSSRT
jgi:dTMP kinase